MTVRDGESVLRSALRDWRCRQIVFELDPVSVRRGPVECFLVDDYLEL